MNFVREKERIFARNQEGRLVAEITFVRRGDLAEINHTFVDPSLRGQGVAGQLVQAAAEALREENCKIYPTCSYARRWFEEHPEYGALLE